MLRGGVFCSFGGTRGCEYSDPGVTVEVVLTGECSADQTYTSCLDFVQEGSGPAPGATSTAPSTSTPTTTTIGTWGCTPLPR